MIMIHYDHIWNIIFVKDLNTLWQQQREAARATLWLLCGKKPVGVVNIVVTVPGARKEAEAFPEVLWVAEYLDLVRRYTLR